MCLPGVVAISAPPFTTYDRAGMEMSDLDRQLKEKVEQLNNVPLIVVCDNSEFTARSLQNFLWITFTRCNPSHDIHGIGAFTRNKHWGCEGSMIIDARIKPHHAPPVEKDPGVEKKIDRLFSKGGSLHSFIK